MDTEQVPYFSFGHFSLRKQLANLIDLIASELRPRMLFAFQVRHPVALLARHVCRVVGARPQPEVVGPHARRVVALVEYAYLIVDRAVGQDVGDAVSQHMYTAEFGKEDVARTPRDGSVSVRLGVSCPHPAWPKFGPHDRAVTVDARPEPFKSLLSGAYWVGHALLYTTGQISFHTPTGP